MEIFAIIDDAGLAKKSKAMKKIAAIAARYRNRYLPT
jgi:hypothetical protein